MLVPVKGIVAGLAVLGVGGLGIWLTTSGGMPPWKALGTDSSASTTYTGKFADGHLNYLVSGDNQDNENWWKWSFGKRPTHEDRKGKFKTIKDVSALKTTCKEAYSAATANVKKHSDSNINDSSDFVEEDIWNFCSPLGQKPVTVEGNNDTGKYTVTNNLGNSKKSELVSTHSKANALFWDLRQREFFSTTGSAATANGFFKTFYDSENSKAENDRKHIKDKCEEGYGKAAGTDSSAPTEAELVKYCSLKGKGSSG